jgi:hypothetical protein
MGMSGVSTAAGKFHVRTVFIDAPVTEVFNGVQPRQGPAQLRRG